MSIHPSLQSLVESTTLQWIFVGGKGGVGKTTTSCSLATLLARTPKKVSTGGNTSDTTTVPRRVLIVSTDPAHNVSDAFSQPFTSTATPVKGIENLDAIEINPSSMFRASMQADTSNKSHPHTASGESSKESSSMESTFHALRTVIQQAASSLPGIDEVTVLVEIMKQVEALKYDVVVFDTAPTGHTLRLLALPHTLQETMDRIFEVQGIKNLISMCSSFMGGNLNLEDIMTTVHQWRTNIGEIQAQFTDHTKTAFVCVCIPEFLPVYETERLVQELSKYNINCEHIVVNQVIKIDHSEEAKCRMCHARIRIQSKYLKQIHDLYDDFHIVEMPMLCDEVRGTSALMAFSNYLLTPYDVKLHGMV